MKLIHAVTLALPLMLTIPTAHAVNLRQWDSIAGSIAGSITVEMNSGKEYKDSGAFLTTTDITLQDGRTIPRRDVRDVVVREVRTFCCSSLWWAPAGVVLGVSLLDSHPLAGLLITTVCLPVAAVTLPPGLVIELFRHLRPAREIYRIAP